VALPRRSASTAVVTCIKTAIFLAGALLLLAALLPGCARHAPETWRAIEVPTDADFRGLWFTDSLHGWMTGGGAMVKGGIIGRTDDGGRTWRFQSGIVPDAGAYFGLGRVQMLDSLHGSVVGSGGTPLVTDDGGETWRRVPNGGAGDHPLLDVQFIDDRKGWAAGPSTVIRSEDGGETWEPIVYRMSARGALSPRAIHFTDSNRGWLVSQLGILLRTDDGGHVWDQVPLPLAPGEYPMLWDVTFSDARNGWIAGDGGTIFHTADGGTTWSRQTNGVPIVRPTHKGEPHRPREVPPELGDQPDRLTVSAIQFVDANQGCAIGYYARAGESVILGTADGGATWRVESVVPGETLHALFMLDAHHAWAAGDRRRTAPQVVMRYTRDER